MPNMENPFIVEVKEVEQKLTPRQYLMQEMLEDISLFSAGAQKAIKELAKGNDNLDDELATALKDERDVWWMEKYGFPYKQKQARIEVLMRKYAPPAEKAKAMELQRSLLEALKNDDQEKVKELQEMYFREYPDQLEGVTVLFELANFNKLNKKVSEDRKEYKTQKSDFEELTQYQFLLTDFILYNSEDKEFMQNFWKVWAKISEDQNLLREFNLLKRGILSQVAVHKLFDKLGYSPRLAHPREDAFDAIDIWTEAGDVVQIKGTDKNQPVILESEEIAFPAVEVKDKGTLKYLNSFMMQHAQRFRTKLQRFNEKTHQAAKGYFVVIPYTKFDHITGEPDREFVERVRVEFTT